MRAVLSLTILLTFVSSCLAQAPAAPQYEGSLQVSSYNNGYFVHWGSPEHKYDSVVIYGPDLKPLYSAPLHIAPGVHQDVWAVDSDGVVARGSWSKNEGQIDFLDLTGKSVRTIKTGTYLPQQIIFAPDHTLWTIGFDTQYQKTKDDFNIVRNYARTGEELRQALPWSQIPHDYNPQTALQAIIGGQKLYSSQDRIGFNVGLHEGRGTWIEVSFSGNVLAMLDLGDYRGLYYSPAAITADGTVYAHVCNDMRWEGWAKFDRSQQTWRKISSPIDGKIVGADQNNVVTLKLDGGWTVLRSVPQDSLHVVEPIQTTALSTFGVAAEHHGH